MDRPPLNSRTSARPARTSVSNSLSLGILLALGALQLPAGEPAQTELAEGKRLYTAKCAKCHDFYDPAAYNAADWDTWMDKMAKKSKLKPAPADLVKRYAATLRAAGKASVNK